MAGTMIHMGTLARPHGIKGEICIDWHADSPLLLDVPLWLQAGNGAPRRVRAMACRWASVSSEMATTSFLAMQAPRFSAPSRRIFHTAL